MEIYEIPLQRQGTDLKHELSIYPHLVTVHHEVIHI